MAARESMRNNLSFGDKLKIAKFLEALGQEAIDRGHLSSTRLAIMTTKDTKVKGVTAGHIKKILPELGMRLYVAVERRVQERDQELPVGTDERLLVALAALRAELRTIAAIGKQLVELWEVKPKELVPVDTGAPSDEEPAVDHRLD